MWNLRQYIPGKCTDQYPNAGNWQVLNVGIVVCRENANLYIQ